jgi:hypothetical protein
MALCLCCGSEFNGYAEDCPNVQQKPHSATLARDVANYLVAHGCEHPRPLDVRMAVQALDAKGRV